MTRYVLEGLYQSPWYLQVFNTQLLCLPLLWSVFSPLSESYVLQVPGGWQIHNNAAFRLAYIAVLASSCLTKALCVWDCKLAKLLCFNWRPLLGPNGRLRPPTHALIRKTDGSYEDIVPVTMAAPLGGLGEPKWRTTLRGMMTWTWSDGGPVGKGEETWTSSAPPSDRTVTLSALSAPSEEDVNASRFSHGTNDLTLPTPSFPSLVCKQMQQPFFAFQVLCCLLWALDEYWYYSLLTLAMLSFFECTLAYQSYTSSKQLAQSASQGASQL